MSRNSLVETVIYYERLQFRSFSSYGKDGYNIDGRAYGRLLFDTNIVFGKIGYLIRLGMTYPNQLVSRMENIRKA